MFRKLLTFFSSVFLVLVIQSCGGGTAGDAEQNVERTIFAVGDVFETVLRSQCGLTICMFNGAGDLLFAGVIIGRCQ